MPEKYWDYNIGTLDTPVRFSIVYGGAKSRVACPHDGGGGGALKSEKSLSPPISVGGGAVDTNDWCIIRFNTVRKGLDKNRVNPSKNLIKESPDATILSKYIRHIQTNSTY